MILLEGPTYWLENVWGVSELKMFATPVLDAPSSLDILIWSEGAKCNTEATAIYISWNCLQRKWG